MKNVPTHIAGMKGEIDVINTIKDKLLNEPEKIKEVLEHYGYCNVVIRGKYITCGRASDTSPKSIVIRLENNEALLVHDYARNVICDIINFIIKQKNVTFKDVISYLKLILNIDSYYVREERVLPFGGFYSKIKNRNSCANRIYDDTILDRYEKCGNERFLKDGITLEAQRHFNIGYSIEEQAITIPIYDEIGNIIGIKARINKDPKDGEQKYFYLTSGCMMSNTLYGYYQNYKYLEGAENIYIYESEKSCLQSWGFDKKECLSLGSSSISKKQAQLILSLNPKNVYLMFDKGLEPAAIIRNIKTLRAYGRLKEFGIYIWMPNENIPLKSSPSDLGEVALNNAISNECISDKEYLKLYEEVI